MRDNAEPEVRAQGAKHGADVPFVFDTLERNDGYIASEAERMLVGVMMGSWSQMATAGTPQHPGLPLWPAYDDLRLDSPTSVEQGFRARQCDFWDYLNSIRPPGY